MAKISFNNIWSRLTGIGFSTPVFGLSASWSPPESDRRIAENLILFLEDRRVLYTPYNAQMPYYAVESIRSIRERLRVDLERCEDKSSRLSQAIRGMLAACRSFLSNTESGEVDKVSGKGKWTGKEIAFFGALGQLRNNFGFLINSIAVAYGIDLEEELVVLVPASEP